MTVTDLVISFVVMAFATMTILVVCTLGAADLLHPRRGDNDAAARSNSADDSSDRLDVGPGPGVGDPAHSEPESRTGGSEAVDVLMPRRASPTFNRRRPSAPGTDHVDKHDDPSHGRAA